MADELGEAALRGELPPPYELVIRERADAATLEASRLARAGADEGTLVWVHAQEDGRTQQGAPWHSPRGGLYAALVLRPDYPRARWPELVAVAAVSAGGAIAELAQPMTPLAYRWPNDLLIAPDCLGTVLYRPLPEQEALVLGWSVNVAPPAEPGGFACVALEGGAETTPGELLGRTARFFLDWINRWAEEGFGPVRQAWQRRGLLEHAPHGMAAMPVSVDEDGALMVRAGDQQRKLLLADALAAESD